MSFEYERARNDTCDQDHEYKSEQEATDGGEDNWDLDRIGGGSFDAIAGSLLPMFVTFDEGGGYWDSGFFQPIDFFGDGPRIPFIAISKYSRGGRVVHSYADHASVLKFIERNWRLNPLTSRSRDNLPNPVSGAGSSYVPLNMPAISDLFDMFDFDSGQGEREP